MLLLPDLLLIMIVFLMIILNELGLLQMMNKPFRRYANVLYSLLINYRYFYFYFFFHYNSKEKLPKKQKSEQKESHRRKPGPQQKDSDSEGAPRFTATSFLLPRAKKMHDNACSFLRQ